MVLGGIGDDVLEGGDGKDQLEGGDGDDFIFGDRGDDTIIGGKGNDRLQGNDGNDLFLVTDHTTDGADKYDGGAGIDTIDFSASSKAITSPSPTAPRRSAPTPSPIWRTSSVAPTPTG